MQGHDSSKGLFRAEAVFLMQDMSQSARAYIKACRVALLNRGLPDCDLLRQGCYIEVRLGSRVPEIACRTVVNRLKRLTHTK